MHRRLWLPSAAALLALCGPPGSVELAAQTPAPAQPAPATPQARPGDVATVDAIIAALYDVISGPAGAKRDWDRMRSLFLPEGRLIPVGPRREGGYRARMLTVEDYVTNSGPLLERIGFREREIARRTEHFGNIAHVFSTYEGKGEREMTEPMRGINSIQLMNDGTRWWIVSVFWEGERPDNPLPERYLTNG